GASPIAIGAAALWCSGPYEPIPQRIGRSSSSSARCSQECRTQSVFSIVIPRKGESYSSILKASLSLSNKHRDTPCDTMNTPKAEQLADLSSVTRHDTLMHKRHGSIRIMRGSLLQRGEPMGMCQDTMAHAC